MKKLLSALLVVALVMGALPLMTAAKAEPVKLVYMTTWEDKVE